MRSFRLLGSVLLLAGGEALLLSPHHRLPGQFVAARASCRCPVPICSTNAVLDGVPTIIVPAYSSIQADSRERHGRRRAARRTALAGCVAVSLLAPARLLAPHLAPPVAAMCRSYSAAALARPLLTKSATSAVAYFLGDSVSQWAAGSTRPLDSGRVARATAAGAVSHGPQLHYWSLFLDRYVDFAGPPWVGLLAKIALDQTIFSLYLNAAFCAFTETLQGRSIRQTARKVRAAAWPCLRAGWRFWPAAHALTYSVVPAHLRVLWVDVLEVAWVAILASCVSKSGVGHSTAEQQVAGPEDGEDATTERTDTLAVEGAGVGAEAELAGVSQPQLAWG